MLRKNSKPGKPVKNKEGKPITDIQGQSKRWVEHFEELFNRPAPLNSSDIEAAHADIPIVFTKSMIELRMDIIQIKSGKATGPDNKPDEALKSDIKVTAKMLHILLKIWKEEQVPTD
ncbi:unnamed protein product [Schistosoma curassoni]|uniref:Transposase n=1 Tax=Schistosoma curassoni TaxID=6186 RepID=A0A183KWJ6_9TREM|nr:unnamed protein product [Schistosoma curassoni]